MTIKQMTPYVATYRLNAY